MAGRDDREIARQGRQAAIAIAASGLLAILAPAIIRLTGLPARYEILLYLFAMAGFVWSLAVTWKIWQKGRD